MLKGPRFTIQTITGGTTRSKWSYTVVSPSSGSFKVNLDGAISNSVKESGTEVVMRDCYGKFVCKLQPEHAEALAASVALDFRLESGSAKVIPEKDSKGMIVSNFNDKQNMSDIGNFIGQIQ